MMIETNTAERQGSHPSSQAVDETTVTVAAASASADGGEQAGVDDDLIEQLAARAKAGGVSLTGEGGLLQQLTKKLLESALDGELIDHLGYDQGQRRPAADVNTGNWRNGSRAKTVITDVGPVEVSVPRDRAGTSEPKIVRKHQRRLSGVDEMVLSLAAKGLTSGEISAHLAEVYGAEVSKQTISTITDKVIEGMAEWQNRPLDAVYPVIFIDALHVKIRDGQVANQPIPRPRRHHRRDPRHPRSLGRRRRRRREVLAARVDRDPRPRGR
jgi:putative transposase